MVAAAVGAVIIVAALAAFDIQSKFSRDTERLLTTQSTASLALTMMQRDLENAGLRFRGGVQDAGGNQWAAVVRPYDNLGASITQLRNDTGSGKVVAVSGASAGFVPGTDAFEVLLGSQALEPLRLGAQVASVGARGGSTLVVGVIPFPFTPLEVAAAKGTDGPVVMFWNDDIHCMGRLSDSDGTSSITVRTLDVNLNNASTSWSSNLPLCPAALMRVEVLQTRRRYLVYQSDDAAGKPARLGLYVQSNAPCSPADGGLACNSNLQAPRMVAEGIDDMQIAWRVPAGWGPDGGEWCDRSATENCGFDLPTAGEGQLAASILGAEIYVAARGPELLRRPNEPVPQLLNHVPAVPVDGIVRSLMQGGVLFRNVVNP